MDFSEDRAFLEQQDRDYRRAILSIIRGDSSDELMRSLLEDYHANDIASVLEELSEEENEKLLRVLGNEAMAEIVAYLETEYRSGVEEMRKAAEGVRERILKERPLVGKAEAREHDKNVRRWQMIKETRRAPGKK